MNILSKISSILRIPPSKNPLLSFDLFPLPFHKYITIYNEQCVPSNSYDYFNDVMAEIKPFLDSAGIRAIQFLNSADEKRLYGCFCIDKFTYPQMNFLIKNSLLHLCTDSYSNDVSGILDIPSLCLLGNRHKNNSYPWYGSKKKHLILSELATVKPSFSLTESPKSINKIRIKDISQTCLDLLGIKETISFEQLFIGSKYSENVVCDIIPNFPVSASELPSKNINIRLDKFDGEAYCFDLCKSLKFSLTVNKKTSIGFLNSVKANCNGVTFIIGPNSDTSEVALFVNLGLPVEMVCDKDVITKDFMLKFLDFGRIKTFTTETTPEIRKSLLNKNFRSSKIILSSGKNYPSYYHVEKDVPVGIINKTADSELFWSDDSRYLIFDP